MIQENPEKYAISVGVNPEKPGVIITIDGEKHEADGFLFTAPLGTGFAVRRITQVELVPEKRSKWRGDE